MRYARTLGLIAVAIAGCMALAASASATTGTDSAGGSPVEVGDTFHAVNVGNVVLDGTIKVSCATSTVQTTVTNAGSSTETLSGHLTSLSFNSCGANTVAVFIQGTLALHTDTTNVDNGNGTLTSSGTWVTVLTHNILGTIHCIYVTNNTDVGTVDGSNNTGGTATLTVDSVPLPQEPTDPGCSNDAEWTGEYTITTPDYLYIH